MLIRTIGINITEKNHTAEGKIKKWLFLILDTLSKFAARFIYLWNKYLNLLAQPFIKYAIKAWVKLFGMNR